MTQTKTIYCSSPVYRYAGVTFEINPAIGPWPRSKFGKQLSLANKEFWDLYDKFSNLPEKIRESYRINL